MSSALGIHHVTAIASDPQKNVDFYAGLLGLRLVKRTVNFDDPQSYHFYFGDEIGNPGSLLTFFPWPGARPGRPGSGQVAVTSLAIPHGAVGFWIERLLHNGVAYQGPLRRIGAEGSNETVISFRDRDGLMLELIAGAEMDDRSGWEAPGIVRHHAIRGLHSVTLWAEDGDATERILTESLGFRLVGEENSTRRYSMGVGGPGALASVRSIGGFLNGAEGAGTVHHVAWSVADGDAQLDVRRKVLDAGLDPTAVIDRSYFHSVYFREPGGILFELATTQPGFAIDEPVQRLGEQLKLPPHLEPRRAEIETALMPIRLPYQSQPGYLEPNESPRPRDPLP